MRRPERHSGRSVCAHSQQVRRDRQRLAELVRLLTVCADCSQQLRNHEPTAAPGRTHPLRRRHLAAMDNPAQLDILRR
jgi:hypothetical protein